MSITLLYAGALALWFLVLSIRVVQGRVGPGNPSLGDGGNPLMLRRIRAHANFAEYVPMILVMMGFLELNGQPKWEIHLLGAMLLIARLLVEDAARSPPHMRSTPYVRVAACRRQPLPDRGTPRLGGFVAHSWFVDSPAARRRHSLQIRF